MDLRLSHATNWAQPNTPQTFVAVEINQPSSELNGRSADDMKEMRGKEEKGGSLVGHIKIQHIRMLKDYAYLTVLLRPRRTLTEVTVKI